jgi:hypothetical protein
MTNPRLKSHDFLTSQQFKHLSEKEMCQNSNIGTIIGFVKYSRKNTLLKTIPKNNLE